MKVRQDPKDLLATVRLQVFIKRWERLRLTRYFDQGGKPTIGYGHLMMKDEPTVIDLKQADRLFREDLKTAADAVRRLVTVPLWQSEFDALVSLVWNIGVKAFRSSTLRKRLNEGDYRAASAEFIKWHFVDGEPSAGLLKRREAERALFNETPF